jgi:H+/Cl- antiporter ClcA
MIRTSSQNYLGPIAVARRTWLIAISTVLLCASVAVAILRSTATSPPSTYFSSEGAPGVFAAFCLWAIPFVGALYSSWALICSVRHREKQAVDACCWGAIFVLLGVLLISTTPRDLLPPPPQV